MKSLHKALLAVTVGSFLSMGAQAAMGDMAGSPYVGAKVGKFMVDADPLDDLTAYGVYGGYNFTPNVGIEAEYMTSSDEDVDGTDLEFSVKSYGAYGTYRYAFPDTAIYVKGKLGVAKAEAKIEGEGESVKSDDTGVAGGVGLGYNFTPNVAVEAEYAFLASDLDLLTIGASYKF